MKSAIASVFLVLTIGYSKPAQADLWGADLPLLVEIVANTLNTLIEIREQTTMLKKELRGIDDKIFRLKAIQEMLKPDDLAGWKDPREALRRLQGIYYNLPPEFRTQKSDEIERRLSQSMGLAGSMVDSAESAFKSGKQLEREGLEVGPAVANKMTASGVGTLIALQSQAQVAQATIISLLSQEIAENGSKEVSRLKSQSNSLKNLGKGLKGFSGQVDLSEVTR